MKWRHNVDVSKKNVLREAGRRLRQLREQWGYTRSDLAGRLGVTRGGLGKNERGENLPATKVLFRLSSEYGISMDWLLFGKGAKKFKDAARLEELETRVKEQDNRLAELQNQLEQAQAQSREDQARLRQLEEETAHLRHASPELKEMIQHMLQDPVLYHDLLLRFFSYMEEKPQPKSKSKKTKK
jgi:transcriptional regulator with XRE-family HTH domain